MKSSQNENSNDQLRTLPPYLHHGPIAFPTTKLNSVYYSDIWCSSLFLVNGLKFRSHDRIKMFLYQIKSTPTHKMLLEIRNNTFQIPPSSPKTTTNMVLSPDTAHTFTSCLLLFPSVLTHEITFGRFTPPANRKYGSKLSTNATLS